MVRKRRQQSNPFLVIAIVAGCLFVGCLMMAGIAIVAWRSMARSGGGAKNHTANTAPGGDAANNSGGSFGVGSLLGTKLPYSQRTKEKTLPADQAPLDTPLRSHKDHPWVTLVKAEIEKSDGRRLPLPFWQDGETIVLDYESSADILTHPVMTHGRVCIILKNDKGEETEWHYRNYAQIEAKGSWIMVDGRGSGPFGFPAGPPGFPGPFGRSTEKAFTPNMEIFVLLEDWYDRKAVKRYKISNSLTIGEKSGVTMARDWRENEAPSIEESLKTKTKTNQEEHDAIMAKAKEAKDVFGDKPPANAQRSDTIGAPGGWKYEFAKDAVPVLGFAYRFGSWDGHPCVGQIRPVFNDAPVTEFPERILAKPGYAVGGVKLEVSPYVAGIQVIFMKLDGKRLNPADTYASDWIRAGKEKPESEASYLSEGKLVIGIHGNNGAIVNTMGLIFQ